MRTLRHLALSLGFSLFLLPFAVTAPQGAEGDYDTPPRPITITRPEYPPEAREKGIEGTVIVEITITTDGKVVDPVVIESVKGLDEAAIECVHGWRFKPAEKDGQAVQTTAHAPIAFRLSPPSGPIGEDEV